MVKGVRVTPSLILFSRAQRPWNCKNILCGRECTVPLPDGRTIIYVSTLWTSKWFLCSAIRNHLVVPCFGGIYYWCCIETSELNSANSQAIHWMAVYGVPTYATLVIKHNVVFRNCAWDIAGSIGESIDDNFHNNYWYKSSAVTEMGDRLATMGRKVGVLCPFSWGQLGPHLTQCGLGRGLPPYQVAS